MPLFHIITTCNVILVLLLLLMMYFCASKNASGACQQSTPLVPWATGLSGRERVNVNILTSVHIPVVAPRGWCVLLVGVTCTVCQIGLSECEVFCTMWCLISLAFSDRILTWRCDVFGPVLCFVWVNQLARWDGHVHFPPSPINFSIRCQCYQPLSPSCLFKLYLWMYL